MLNTDLCGLALKAVLVPDHGLLGLKSYTGFLGEMNPGSH